MKKLFLAILLCSFVLAGCVSKDTSAKYDVAISSDAERIAYSTYGAGDVSLIFIHGWSCDSRYWQNQLTTFAKDYHVITIDLAGHGHSSSGRRDYTMASFARDVQAVIEKDKLTRVILIGHSMGGGVMAEAALLMPGKVIGIIGVDTLHNVAEQIPEKVLEDMVKPFEGDFKKAIDDFLSPMLPERTEAALVRWVKEDMSSAPQDVAMSAFRNYLGQFVNGETSEIFKALTIPVVTINARLWPTNIEANKNHIQTYTNFYIEDTGHFPMLERPAAFNKRLTEALGYIESKNN